MIRVEDLIKDSDWFPNKGYPDSGKPKITIVLPVYNAASTSLLGSVLDSILLQQDVELELIIVDDNSTDNTKAVILEYMEKDSRVNLIAYKRNINIFAISAFSAYEKARGESFIFTSQNFIFSKNSFDSLYQQIQKKPYSLIAGWAKTQIGTQMTKEMRHRGIESLNVENTFVSSAVIIPRLVLEDIGLYDPLLLSANYCQWDFWLRSAIQYPVFQLDNLIGVEVFGFLKPPHYLESIEPSLFYVKRIMQLDRNERLRSKGFLKLKITGENYRYIEHDLYPYFEYIEKFLEKKIPPAFSEGDLIKKNLIKKKKILIISSLTASAVLPFFGLKDSEEFEVVYENISSKMDFTFLTKANLVIIVRHLHSSLLLVDKLNQLNIPWAYFIDDNFTLLKQEGYTELNWYSQENLRLYLSKATAVFASAKSLQDYYEEYKIHPHVCVFSPIISRILVSKVHNLSRQTTPRASGRLHIAMVGGAFRHKFFLNKIFPLLVRLSELVNITLWSTCYISPQFEMHDRLIIHKIKLEENYLQFILKLAALDIDIIVHPYGQTSNIEYKVDSIILTARYLQANILVADEPCFEQVDESAGVLKMQNSEEDIYEKLLTLLDNETRKKLFGALVQYCDKHYAQDTSKNILRNLLAESGESSVFEVDRRVLTMGMCFYNLESVSSDAFAQYIFQLIKQQGLFWFFRAILRYSKRYFLYRLEKIKVAFTSFFSKYFGYKSAIKLLD